MAARKRRPLGILATVMIWLTAVGCGSSVPTTNLKVTPVKGSITMGGNPLPEATVSLILEGPPPANYLGSAGMTDAQGKFEIMTGTQKGAPAGTYTVIVSKIVGADGKPLVNDPNSGMDAQMMVASGEVKESVPPTHSDAAQSQTKVIVTDGTPVPDLNIDIPKS
jgi:hypothetical protein